VEIGILKLLPSQIYRIEIVSRKNQEFRFLLPLSNGGDDRYMTVLGKGWAAAKPTTGSSYIALGRNARETLLPAVTVQLGDMTVGEIRTENTVPSGILIVRRITAVTLTWCLLCCNLLRIISLAPLFRLSGVMSKYCHM
jgi:hypothetical protein